MPSEYEEQVALKQYCEIKGYPFFAVPNETYTTSWNQKRLNKAKGVVKGVPDFWVIVRGRLIAIELKRLKGSVVSPEQKAWIEALNAIGIKAAICKGFDAAREFIETS